jgi:hypothetical protein
VQQVAPQQQLCHNRDRDTISLKLWICHLRLQILTVPFAKKNQVVKPMNQLVDIPIEDILNDEGEKAKKLPRRL